jgi:hypothetical protein
MAYKIKEQSVSLAEIHTYQVDLFGAFEGKYFMEERLFTGQSECESFHANKDGERGARVENLDTHLQLLYNLNQWKKGKRNENTIQT